MFQSLFYWIINSIIIGIFNIQLNEVRVSILILLDYQFYQYERIDYNIPNTLFQSLFYWIINSIYSNYSIKVADLFVSILILLDYQFYLLEKQTEIVSYLEGFNPYSTGLSILSHNYNIEYLIIINCFNPYSTGLSILSLAAVGDRRPDVFVSILILLDYQFYPAGSAILDILRRKGFNPYSTGLSILSLKMKNLLITNINVSILILLDYQFYQEKNYNPSERREASFNPYSTGLSILSLNLKLVEVYNLLKFQSLFYWIINSI